MSSWSPAKAQDELNKLIVNNEVQYKSGLIGCCKRNYLIFPNDQHKYYYNHNKIISDSLKKKVYIYLYSPTNNMNKRLNKKTTVLTSSLEVDLKHDYDREEERYWVHKSKFWEFKNEYDELQDGQQNPVSVELHIIAEVFQGTDTIVRKGAFLPTKTVYGGMKGVKLYLKKVIIDSVYAWEDSATEIQHIFLNKLYINKGRQTLSTDIKHIKMYGTAFNYLGYGLMAQQRDTPNVCVPTYLLELYNNENETNPRRRLKKLKIETIVEELGMTSITDGCSTEQIKQFCEKHKITYYALNYKYKTFDTNNHMNYNSNLPRLVFMCANNHLYPIRDEESRASIFKTCSNIGGPMKKYRTQQLFENNKLNISKTTKTFIYEDTMNFYALFNHVRSQCSSINYRIILTVEGSCHNIFYTELKKGNIHNGKVRISSGNTIIGFEMNGIILDENTKYKDIKMTIDTLNEEIKNDSHRYNYTGQHHHNLAHQYFTNNYDKNILSYCSPQLYDILTSKLCMNSPFLEFYGNNGDIAFDINKQYTNILCNCDSFGWSIYAPTDEVKPFDGVIDTGLYYVETNNYFPLKGNGWYFDDTIEKAITYKLIKYENIIYQLKPSFTLKPNHFEAFVHDVYGKFEPIYDGSGGKMAINGFIGLLGKSHTKSNKEYFEINYDIVVNEILNNENVSVSGIYDHTNEINTLNSCNLLNLNDEMLNELINNADERDPMIYRLSHKQQIPLYENSLPIHRKIYDKANMEMYELYMKIKDTNPYAELVGIKTDCLVFKNITNTPPTSDRWGDIKLSNVPLIKECTINQEPKLRTERFELLNNEWNNIKWMDNEHYENHKGYKMDKQIHSYIQEGILFLGMAGTGKSEILSESQFILAKNNAFKDFMTACPTHKACKIVNGQTIHRLFDINPIGYSYGYKKVKELQTNGIKYILLDEISMISERMWCVLAQIKILFNFVFIGFGDFKQLKPINEEYINFRNSWIVKFIFNNTLCELTEIHRFDDDELLQDAYKCSNGEAIDIDKYGKTEHDLSLCWTNRAVDVINEKWNDYYLPNDYIIVNGAKNSKFKLHKGLTIIAYRTHGKKFYNSDEYTVKSYDDKNLILVDENNEELIIDIKLTNHFKPAFALTVHKAQGATINKPYSIYEHKRMRSDMLYVSLTRTKQKEFVNFCDISLYKPYIGYIYKYSFMGKSYIGSTNDIKKRQTEHETNSTYKFGRAIKRIGFSNFKFEILETVKYYDKADLYEIENNYIIKYDSVNNGYNSRRNIKTEQVDI